LRKRKRKEIKIRKITRRLFWWWWWWWKRSSRTKRGKDKK
jgi:hypothetical protein